MPASILEIYDWPEGTPRPEPKVAIDILYMPPSGLAPQKDDILTFREPMDAEAGWAKYRVVERVLMWFSPNREDHQEPVRFMKMWIYVRRVED